MSNLNSSFDILRGWPNGGALEMSLDYMPGVAIEAGTIVTAVTRELVDASVLRIVDSTLVTAPTLTSAGRGKAYVVAGLGGAWSGFAKGDIVEWDGTGWNQIVAGVGEEVADGTRAVVVEASAAGAFTGHEEKVMAYTKGYVTLVSVALGYINCVAGDIGKPVVATGTGDTGVLVSYDNGTRTWVVDPDVPADDFAPGDVLAITGGAGAGTVDTATPTAGAWSVITTPVFGHQIRIVGTDSVYEDKYYVYYGTHPTGFWTKAMTQKDAPAAFVTMTSPEKDTNVKPEAWIVIEGSDQTDAQNTHKITAIKCASGAVLALPCTIADTLVAGDYVVANSGAIAKQTSGAGMEWPIGQVVYSNATAGSSGLIHVATY